ncbi:hypothetical protein HU200_043300 [Digitaria exilis]|uniref:F-box domain-containing protein n=1 Tax=Digitaria exilis TaxID=1010633 RepID=A0A835EE14_9POAL|nr:hypothetical protein HU200_043300 [Digitaria exilis]
MDLKVYKRKGNLKICERKAKRVQQQTFEIPDELVREILIWLPVASLARFKTVSKAWLAIISDHSFVPAHLHCSKQKQQQNPSSFLITPRILQGPGHVGPGIIIESFSTGTRFYHWCLPQVTGSSSATLICRRHFPDGEFGEVVPMAHCDGLILLPTDTKVYVFNPATKDAIALPQSQRNMMRHYGCLSVGSGLDTSIGKYKVARTFHRSSDDGPMEIFTMGMEVFTINGENGSSWRETSVDLPYPILGSQAGTCCQGCLFFFIDKNNQQLPPQGLLRFSLVDETFGVTPLLTNLYPSVEDEDIFINELDGELCASLLSKVLQRVLIFTTSHVMDHPRWDIRYIINVQQCHPVASLGGSVILLRHGCRVFRYSLKAGRIEGEIFDMRDIRYLGPCEDALGHAWENVSWFDLISYTESLVPVTPKANSGAL